MKIFPVTENKKQYIALLLLGDEQESMIDHYLDRGEMFVLDDDGIKAVCVVTDEADGICELKNLAVWPGSQRKGYGKKMIDFLLSHYCGRYTEMRVGTGDVPTTIRFYERCGFTYSHRMENFFTLHYDHLIVEQGIQLKDMIYLKQTL